MPQFSRHMMPTDARPGGPHPAATPDFNDTARAFAAQNDWELLRAYGLFTLMGQPALSKAGQHILSWALEAGLPVEGLVRATLFDIFCGGTSLQDTQRASQKLHQYRIQTILDYSVEGAKTEAGFDTTRDEILRALAHAAQHPEVAFTACKLSGMASAEVLAAIQTAGGTPEPRHAAAWAAAQARMAAIAAAAQRHQTPVFIDAEESWIQAPIDHLAEALMRQHNTAHPWVYTTVQLYRHDRLQYLRGLIADSREQGYILGVKLVRGAYHERESARAAQLGYTDPIQPNKAATDRDFDAALALCMDHIEHVAICAGTHNEASSLRLTQLMAARGIAPGHPHIVFAQLLGMSDHISYNLAAHGYNAAKYLPYGPVKAVMPYLIRRAQENTSVAGQTGRELQLLQKELRRRRA